MITCGDTELFEQAQSTAKEYFDSAYDHLYRFIDTDSSSETLFCIEQSIKLAEIMAKDCNTMCICKRLEEIASALRQLSDEN